MISYLVAVDLASLAAELRARYTTVTIIDGDEAPRAAEGEFDWVVRLAPG